jgi:6-phosphogluconolactonase
MAESGLYVYVSQQGARQISVFRMSASGELNKVHDVSVTGKAMPMAVSPDRRFLFVALRTEPYSIASFAIDGANGMLTRLGNAPAPNSSPYICTDRTGRFLLGAYNPESEGDGRRTGWISVSAIGPHGYVYAPHQVIRTPPKTHSILLDPSNRFAFAASCDRDAMVRTLRQEC